MTSKNLDEDLLVRKKAAAYIGETVSKLNRWASQKKHLKYTIIRKEAHYKKADLDAYLKDRQTF